MKATKEKGLWIINFDDWEYSTSGGEEIPTLKYCWKYLTAWNYHKGFTKRCLELFRRFIKCSLKPSQLPSGKRKPTSSL